MQLLNDLNINNDNIVMLNEFYSLIDHYAHDIINNTIIVADNEK